ncbi:hypothetical protein HHI36_015535 [Cryptolaemus montrouzieri]|uniref:Regulator of microtubule dynamics protein 1 n=1 Tax=Cryptolaemus montrouzieri TaxID=559131 RepID=A0ABD2N7D2_9CUCU
MSKSKYAFLVKTLINLAWPTTTSGRFKAVPFSSYFSENDQPIPTVTNENFNRNWPPHRTMEKILEEADQLYEEEKYIQVYELLNRLKYNRNSNVKWRIARVLYQTTATNNLPLDMKKEIIQEAYELLLDEATEENTNSYIHKWFAIICDCYYRSHSIEKRIEGYHKILKHLRMSYKLNQNDITVCYLLGKLCFDMASLRGFKRFVAKILYSEPPDCTFDEAYKYLCRVEQLSERMHLSNVYLLGRTCYELEQYYKAKHYLNMAYCMTPNCECEKRQKYAAKQLLAKLEKYALGKEVLFAECDYPSKPIYEDYNCAEAENDAETEGISMADQCDKEEYSFDTEDVKQT